MASLTLVTRTTPTPEATFLRWLDGTDGDDHAAYEALGVLLHDAARALREPGQPRPGALALAYSALLRVRDAESEAES